MSRPAVEVADILHAQGDTFLEQHPWLSVQQRSVLRAIARCRTAALGGHLDRCDACGHQAISYNSCRNRHCPKCQAQARERWLHARERELLDVPYVHVVFTLPHGLLPLAYRNSARLYTWLFQASAATLREVAADPRHLGAEIGVLSILHTWGQTLVRHPHVHCVVPAGGLSPDHQCWIHPKYAGFFLPVKVLSRVFRGKFVEALRRAYDRHELDLAGGSEHLRDPAQWHAFVDALFETDWVVYAKPAFGGASAVLRYLGRYTHRVAISNHRLLAFDGEHVTFSYKDYAHGDQRRTMTLTAMEFLRRFVQHILPRGFVRIRQSGFLANTCRTARVALARTVLASPAPPPPSTDATAPATTRPPTRATWACPRCGAAMIVGPILSALQLATVTLELRHAHEPPAPLDAGAVDHVVAHVSGAVCLDRRSRPPRRASPAHAPTIRAGAAVARAPPASRSTPVHARGSRFQLHSRPPRQRLPSSLVIEGVSASASGCSSGIERRDTSDER